MEICTDFTLIFPSSLHFILQFNAYMSVIHEMTSKVEAEHRAKLEQLNSLQQEQK